MRYLELTLPRPEENLALDEILLRRVNGGEAPETLRVWESPRHFVVLGVSQSLAEHVHEAACVADGVPVLRRCSSGGCVLQGPGCLNYTLVLRYENHPGTEGIRPSYQYVLQRIATAMKAYGVDARLCGISDLAAGDLKFSGNAQKRLKDAFMQHGTLLHGLETSLMGKYLKEPDDRPGYRGSRAHGEFVASLALDEIQLRAILKSAFEIDARQAGLSPSDMKDLTQLVCEKYATPEFIRRR
ncbi:MAG: lipoate--protein ligase family protein [Candidatus Hydrogenedentes bacterium]|nr:lipoate--protein ligase family protein [Candidatus Hydrogenedentota bacterium]